MNAIASPAIILNDTIFNYAYSYIKSHRWSSTVRIFHYSGIELNYCRHQNSRHRYNGTKYTISRNR